MNTLSVDPGLRGCGAAFFEGPKLVYANYFRNPEESGRGPKCWFALADHIYFLFKERAARVDRYVLEVPQVYRVSKGDPNDLIEIAAVGAAVGAAFPIAEATAYYPREWKGTQAKEAHHPRILAQLSPDEIEAILEHRKTYRHNVVDAVGLGLYFLERKSERFSK